VAPAYPTHAKVVSDGFLGVMLGKTGGFVAALLVAGSFAILGACSCLFIVGEIEPSPERRP
jgi:hypothetical protein